MDFEAHIPHEPFDFAWGEADSRFGYDPKKKPKYFGASRPSDVLFEALFKREISTSTNCV